MAEAAGGVTALAALLGVSDRTVRRWALHEAVISGVATHAIRAVAKTLKVPAPA